MKLKPWQKTALALTAISVFAGAGYTAYYFLVKKRKEKALEDAEKLSGEKPEEKPDIKLMPTRDIKDISSLIKDTRTIQTNNQQKG